MIFQTNDQNGETLLVILDKISQMIDLNNQLVSSLHKLIFDLAEADGTDVGDKENG